MAIIDKPNMSKVKSELPPDDPVMMGVRDAMQILGGELPPYVAKVEIKNTIVSGQAKKTFVGGRCWSSNQGGAKIEVFAGSIRTSAGSGYSQRPLAAHVLLHEIGHAKMNDRMQIGAWFGCRLSEKDHEVGAEEFVVEACQAYTKRQSRISWGDVLRQRGTFSK